MHLTTHFSVSHDDVYVLNTINSEYNLTYIYHYIKINIQLLINSFKGSTIKHSSKSALSKIKITYPKDKVIISALNATFIQIKQLQDEVKFADAKYRELNPNSNGILVNPMYKSAGSLGKHL